jgi:hypothetical protein
MLDAGRDAPQRENKSMRHLRRTSVAVVAALTATIGSSAAAEAAPTRCAPVHATGRGQDLGNFQTQADIYVLRFRIGSTAATFTPTGQTGTTITFDGPIVFRARLGLGSITVSALGSVDISTGEFTSAGPISATTGIFKGATGNLTFQGTENLSTGAFDETVNGSICAANSLAITALSRG